MSLRGCSGNTTRNLRHPYPIGQRRKRHRRIIRGLHFQTFPINSSTIKSCWCTSFQSSNWQLHFRQPQGQLVRWSLANTPCWCALTPEMNKPTKECPCCQYNGGAMIRMTILGLNAFNFITFWILILSNCLNLI